MKEDTVLKTCILIVQHFKQRLEAHTHTRIFSHILHPEIEYIYEGQSEKVKQEAVRIEHVVPCKVLTIETKKLIREAKYSDLEIAEFLRKNWRVAKITKEEARLLDNSPKNKSYPGLGLRSSMPDGWCFLKDDPLARLKKANITLIGCVAANKPIKQDK